MADNKPLYYGGSKSSKPMYYGGGANRPAYGGRSPAYYGNAYGAGTYGGTYGMQYGGAGNDGSIIGKITFSRMLRVVSQRWLSVFVFLLVGLIAAFAVYRISPTIYEAKSEFSMDMRRSTGGGRGALDQITPDYGSTYEEIFNTRISDWRSDKIVTKIVQQYRANNPASTVSDEEIISTLSESDL